MSEKPEHTRLLFLHTLDRLGACISSNDPFEILDASGELRKLLLDSSPLVNQINREFKLKLRFRVGETQQFPPGFPKPVIWSIQDGLDPDTAPPGRSSKELTRDQFLAFTVLKVRDSEFSVRDVIKFEANVMGGIHSGSPKEAKEQVLAELDRIFELGGHRASLRQLMAIGRVVLKGLEPLQLSVELEDVNSPRE